MEVLWPKFIQLGLVPASPTLTGYGTNLILFLERLKLVQPQSRVRAWKIGARVPQNEDEQNAQDGHSVKDPEAPFMSLQVLQPVLAVVRYLHGAVDGAQGNEDRRQVDGVRELAPEMHVAQVLCRPMPRHVKVADRDDGKADEACHLQDQAQDEYDTSRQGFSLGDADGAVTGGRMVIVPADLGGANELDDKGKQVKGDKGGRDPFGPAPQGFEVEGLGRTAEPDDPAQRHVAGGSQEAGCE